MANGDGNSHIAERKRIADAQFRSTEGLGFLGVAPIGISEEEQNLDEEIRMANEELRLLGKRKELEQIKLDIEMLKRRPL